MKVCWVLTNLCNQDCFYCFRELCEQAKEIEDNIAILYKLKNIGVTQITFSGGEPFLYPGIKTLLACSKKLGIKNAIFTNGSLLNEQNITEYLKDIDKLTFSIDSPSSYVNGELGRGRNHYEHIRSILPIIRQHFPNLEIEINSVVTRNNVSEVDFMFEALGTDLVLYGIKKWKISRFFPLRGYAKVRKNLLSIPDEVFASIRDKYDGKNASFAISVRDICDIENNLIISPQGSIKKSDNSAEKVLVEDILKTESTEIKKVLTNGGYYV